MKRTLLLGGGVALCLFCSTLPLFAADGFGQNATGGAGGTIVTVSTASDFKTYVESTSTYIVQVSGTIDLGSVGGGVDIRSNKTIKGISSGAKIIGRLGFRDDANNIIIEKLTITNLNYAEKDGISVKERVTNLFITKCTVYDCCDGCIDITNASDYVTVSWCKFYYTKSHNHRFVNLIGSSYPAPDDVGKLHVTFHHNWWSTLCIERMLSVRYGRAHIYNNYYSCTGNNYCTRSRVDAECRIENNYFEGVKDPHVRYVEATGVPPGKIYASGNVYISCTGKMEDGDTVFMPPYSYTLDTGANVKNIVMNGAGADGNDVEPPSAPTGLTAITGEANVPLDWNDNSESDLAGYNVYRSTTSDSNYSKLNSSLLSDSNYTDNNIPHDTTYYYVVTAVDANSNESNHSNEVFGGLYGDFTGNGIVAMNDLPDFLDFWLIDDCYETAGMDLDNNCIVNFYEFSVLAENWLE